MDESTFTALTGTQLGSIDSDRFYSVLAVATAELEKQLGYPLDPSDWSNLYIETGKTQDESCPDVVTDDTDLDDPDEVEGAYRLYSYTPTDRFLHIDPALAIHKVKLVNDGITYKTFDDDDSDNEFMVKWENANPQITQYLDLSQSQWPQQLWPCWKRLGAYQLAVDADWAWEVEEEAGEGSPAVYGIPQDLMSVLAHMTADAFRGHDEADVQSESRGTHSYTKYDKQTTAERYPILKEYAGPNGLAKATRPV